jgi:hypothetical protein
MLLCLALASAYTPIPQLTASAAAGRRRHCAIVSEEDKIVDTPSLANGEEQRQRLFEVCKMDKAGEIEECALNTADELAGFVGEARAEQIFSDARIRDASMFFSPASKEDALLTAEDLQACYVDDVCEVSEDMLLRAFGPDAFVTTAHTVPPSDCLQCPVPSAQCPLTAWRCVHCRFVKIKNKQREEADTHEQLPPSTKPRFHLHFGAGRLGMGLVVPAIAASGTPFGIVQRPKRKWMTLFQRVSAVSDADQIVVSTNDAIVVQNVEVIKTSSEDAHNTLMPPCSLVFGSSTDELGSIVARATSFSCSLGSAMSSVLIPLLADLPIAEHDAQPLLFCCENDHDAVMKLKEELAGHVRVIDCMVDRVCTGRTISSMGVDVATEPWCGSIVVLEPNLTKRLPFHSSVATAPSTAAECDYLSERKLPWPTPGTRTPTAPTLLTDGAALCASYR